MESVEVEDDVIAAALDRTSVFYDKVKLAEDTLATATAPDARRAQKDRHWLGLIRELLMTLEDKLRNCKTAENDEAWDEAMIEVDSARRDLVATCRQGLQHVVDCQALVQEVLGYSEVSKAENVTPRVMPCMVWESAASAAASRYAACASPNDEGTAISSHPDLMPLKEVASKPQQAAKLLQKELPAQSVGPQPAADAQQLLLASRAEGSTQLGPHLQPPPLRQQEKLPGAAAAPQARAWEAVGPAGGRLQAGGGRPSSEILPDASARGQCQASRLDQTPSGLAASRLSMQALLAVGVSPGLAGEFGGVVSMSPYASPAPERCSMPTMRSSAAALQAELMYDNSYPRLRTNPVYGSRKDLYESRDSISCRGGKGGRLPQLALAAPSYPGAGVANGGGPKPRRWFVRGVRLLGSLVATGTLLVATFVLASGAMDDMQGRQQRHDATEEVQLEPANTALPGRRRSTGNSSRDDKAGTCSSTKATGAVGTGAISSSRAGNGEGLLPLGPRFPHPDISAAQG